MIYITENTPTKISGVTSLYVSFKFNPEIINIIKTADKYIYNKKTYTWELPVTCLTYLLDNLTYIDDITLTLLKDDNKQEHFIPKLVDTYKFKPFDYQLEGIEYFLNHDKGLLLDQMGLGKTYQIIHLAEELKYQKGIEHCLIICGINSLKANWKKEIKTHSNLSYRVIGEKVSKKGNVSYSSVKERANELRENLDAFFYIINIESLRNPDVVEAIRKSKNKIDMVVVDEIHKCFVGTTKITTNKGKKAIKDIIRNPNNYLVKTIADNGNVEFNKILNSFTHTSCDLIELKIKDEKDKIHKIVCTSDHPIYTKNRGYVQAQYLNEMDILEIDC